jgi:hypothetical protein
MKKEDIVRKIMIKMTRFKPKAGHLQRALIDEGILAAFFLSLASN